jgi:hypothetical protein
MTDLAIAVFMVLVVDPIFYNLAIAVLVVYIVALVFLFSRRGR